MLLEKKLRFDEKIERFWELDTSFAALNSAMEVPVLVEENSNILAGTNAILEYLEEVYPEYGFLGLFPHERAETRRLTEWFHQKCYKEVSGYIIGERVLRYYQQNGEPRSDTIRAAKTNLSTHLDYISFLLSSRTWLCGESISIADFAAAVHLSILDYFGDIPWHSYPSVKEWYALIKSRPSFRPLLEDEISGFRPCTHYTNLDF